MNILLLEILTFQLWKEKKSRIIQFIPFYLGRALKFYIQSKTALLTQITSFSMCFSIQGMFVFHMTFIVSPTRAHVRSHTKVQFFALKIISEIMRDAEFQVFITQRQNNHLHALNVKLTRQFVIVEDKQEGVSLWFPKFKKRHDILF